MKLRPYQNDAATFIYERDRTLILAPKEVRRLLSYCADTGVFRWAVAKSRIRIGMIAGNRTRKGYVCIETGGHQFKAHRLAWVHYYGVWPTAQIDHINGIRDDNRICNLREATREDNGRNKRRQKNNTSGTPGVTWRESHRKWCARITVNGARLHLGYFDIYSDAVAQRKAAEVTHFGAFAPSVCREESCR